MPMGCDMRIVICACKHGGAVRPAGTDEVIAAVGRSGAAFTVVDDLCGLAANDPGALRQMASSGDLRVAACYPRAIGGLFAYAGADLPAEGVTLANMRTQPADEVVAAMLDGIEPPCCSCYAGGRSDLARGGGLAAGGDAPDRPAEWVPWFPVIDRHRCDGCATCLSFCLFGVYAPGEARAVEVRHPANCKTNCPACARVCPRGAIMFPKHADPSVCGGDAPGAPAVDVGSLTSGDVLARLRTRGGARELAEALGVPPDVLEAASAGQAGAPGCDRDCDRGGAGCADGACCEDGACDGPGCAEGTTPSGDRKSAR
jgi:NAD-dependent dihydropyrimidine dehydrogenase PreA subunit